MRLTLGPNQTLDVDAPVVVGREPSKDGFVPVGLDDSGFSASRNHALIVPLADGLVEVTDLASTNGTAIRFDGPDIALRPHESTAVTLPCTVVCGDCEVGVSPG